METGKVFISSVINPNTEDLRAERLVAKDVVESYRFLRPWAFESAPASSEKLDNSYFRHVDESDLVILIVGQHASEPVAAECLRAKERRKPILAFARNVPNRSALAASVLQMAGVKYAPFDSIEDFRNAVRDAIDAALLLGLRSLTDTTGTRSLVAELRKLGQDAVTVRIRPLVPESTSHRFFTLPPDSESVRDYVRFQKYGEHYVVSIPTPRINEILYSPPPDDPVILLNGRLQYITPEDAWKFLEDRPDPSDHFGLPKLTSIHDPAAMEVKKTLEPRGNQFRWGHCANFGALVRDGLEIVYDVDGRYFRVLDRSGDLVFIHLRKKT